MQKYLSSEMQYYGDEEEPKKIFVWTNQLFVRTNQDQFGRIRINSDKLTICLHELRFNLNE